MKKIAILFVATTLVINGFAQNVKIVNAKNYLRDFSESKDIESLNKSFEDELLRAYRGLQGHRIVGEWLQLDSKLSTENITTRVIDNLEHLLAPKKLCRGAFL